MGEDQRALLPRAHRRQGSGSPYIKRGHWPKNPWLQRWAALHALDAWETPQALERVKQEEKVDYPALLTSC